MQDSALRHTTHLHTKTDTGATDKKGTKRYIASNRGSCIGVVQIRDFLLSYKQDTFVFPGNWFISWLVGWFGESVSHTRAQLELKLAPRESERLSTFLLLSLCALGGEHTPEVEHHAFLDVSNRLGLSSQTQRANKGDEL